MCLTLVQPKVVVLTENIAAKLSTTAMLMCVAHGHPLPTVQWKKDDAHISNDLSTVKYLNCRLPLQHVSFTIIYR